MAAHLDKQRVMSHKWFCFEEAFIYALNTYFFFLKEPHQAEKNGRNGVACILQYIYDAVYKRLAKSSGKGSSIIQA